MSGRAGEPDKVHFRAERFEFSNGQWFYLTREGIQHGPYASREEAEKELKFYLQKIGVYETHPDRSDPEAVAEENRKYGAIDDNYPGSR